MRFSTSLALLSLCAPWHGSSAQELPAACHKAVSLDDYRPAALSLYIDNESSAPEAVQVVRAAVTMSESLNRVSADSFWVRGVSSDRVAPQLDQLWSDDSLHLELALAAVVTGAAAAPAWDPDAAFLADYYHRRSGRAAPVLLMLKYGRQGNRAVTALRAIQSPVSQEDEPVIFGMACVAAAGRRIQSQDSVFARLNWAADQSDVIRREAARLLSPRWQPALATLKP